MTYTEIRALAVQLSRRERARLIADLAATLVEAPPGAEDEDAWDVQIEADVQAGKLDALADSVLADCAAGYYIPL